jgi:hypothetical protein
MRHPRVPIAAARLVERRRGDVGRHNERVRIAGRQHHTAVADPAREIERQAARHVRHRPGVPLEVQRQRRAAGDIIAGQLRRDDPFKRIHAVRDHGVHRCSSPVATV